MRGIANPHRSAKQQRSYERNKKWYVKNKSKVQRQRRLVYAVDDTNRNRRLDQNRQWYDLNKHTEHYKQRYRKIVRKHYQNNREEICKKSALGHFRKRVGVSKDTTRVLKPIILTMREVNVLIRQLEQGEKNVKIVTQRR